MKYDINFDVYCSCLDSNTLINYMKKYVLNCGGKFDYVKEGFLRHHITFYITIEEKYKNAILRAYTDLQGL